MSVHVMGFRPLGGPVLAITNRLELNNGLTIPQLGFGTYRMTADEAGPAVSYALDCGYRHVDCAKAYNNQHGVGEALAKAFKTRRVQRPDVFITSKLWPTDQHPNHVEAACRQTLEELRLDYLDLYLIHWPVCLRQTSPTFRSDADKYPVEADGSPAIDPSVTLLDTWRAMATLVKKGLVKSIGVSNCSVEHIHALTAAVDAGEKDLPLPVLNQVELHPGHVDGALGGCQANYNILTAAYCPLGVPTSASSPKTTSLITDDVIVSLGDHIGFSPARLLLNWNVDRNNVVIVKSTNKDHIKSNAKAARFALGDSSRVVLESYRWASKQSRLMNPTHFTKDRRPFFEKDDARLLQEFEAQRKKIDSG